MIHVVAVITAKPGQREPILAAIRANPPAVRAEKGCIEYGPAIDADGGGFQTAAGPDTVFVIEKWDDAAALRGACDSAPHMATYAAKVGELVASRAIYVLSPAS
jgi:quinol monooxygenase YgiN